jgi:hypothetical protein
VEDGRGLVEEALDSVVMGWESAGNAAIIRRISYQWKMGMVQLVEGREGEGREQEGRKERKQRLFTRK